MKPIFLLSLPRAGSTLLQRLLSLYDCISTRSEPWVALPVFFPLGNKEARAIYGHKTLCTAMDKFISSFPNGMDDYYAVTSEYVENMYSLCAKGGESFFLDKTPRYHLIADCLLDAFPDAKFIFLWRNPLAVSASMLQTYGNGTWNLYMFWVDLYSGVESLVNAYNKSEKRVISVRYEDIVTAPDQEMSRITDYLGVENKINVADKLANAEKMWGDRTGQYRYDALSNASVDSWKRVLSNPFRKAWSKRYLDWIGESRLAVMGYDLKTLHAEIEAQAAGYEYLASDLLKNFYGKLYCRYLIDEIRSNKPWNESIFFCRN